MTKPGSATRPDRKHDARAEDPRADAAPSMPQSLHAVLMELRNLAVVALDAGHPLAAAMIAGTADRLESENSKLPPRPRYG